MLRNGKPPCFVTAATLACKYITSAVKTAYLAAPRSTDDIAQKSLYQYAKITRRVGA